MANWYKYLLFFGIFIVAFVLIASIALRHETNITATQEVYPTLESAKTGEVRTNATNAIDQKALVANFILETVNSHKEQGEDIKIDYVFLDESGNVTEDEENIHSVQFKVDVLNGNHEVVSTSRQRLSLNKKD